MLNAIYTKSAWNICSSFRLFCLILLIILGLNNNQINAQIFGGNATLTTQAEVDAFNYSGVTGFLIISGSDITNLDGLSNLTAVGNSMIIQLTSALLNINGLSNLTFVGGFLHITDNLALVTLEGLYSLTYVGENLIIANNNSLTNINDLSSLATVETFLLIENNTSLSEFCGLFTLLNGNGLAEDFIVRDNAANPTQQEIISGGTCFTIVIVCPVSQGNWKNNPVWPVEEIILGTQIYSQINLINILKMPVGSGNRADASLILSKQLIAAKLNIENGADASGAVEDAIESADGLIGNSPIPMNVHPKTALGKQMTNIAGLLDIYNSGELNEGCTLAKSDNTESDELKLREPSYFVLEQNYPNPFNPSTKISYKLPVSGNIMLKVYDMLGNEVASLVNEEKIAGTYDVTFNARGLSSGIYLYKLQTQDFTDTKKLILMK